MSVRYIPFRTFASLALSFIGSVLMIAGMLSEHWMYAEAHDESKLHTIQGQQSLRSFNVFLCTPAAEASAARACFPEVVDYGNCDTGNLWCKGSVFFSTTIVFGAIAACLSVVCTAVWCMCDRHVWLAGGVAAVLGGVCYAIGYSTMMNDGIGVSFSEYASRGGGGWSSGMGYSFYLYYAGVLLYVGAGCFSLSVLLCAPNGGLAIAVVSHENASPATRGEEGERSSKHRIELTVMPMAAAFSRLGDEGPAQLDKADDLGEDDEQQR